MAESRWRRWWQGRGYRRRIEGLVDVLERGEWARAEPLARALVDESIHLFGDEGVETIAPRYALASALLGQGEPGLLEEAAAVSERAVALGRAHPADADPPLPQLLEQLAAICNHRGRDDQLEALLRDMVQSFDRMRAPDPIDHAAALNRLAMLLAQSDRRVEAEPLFSQAVTVAENASLGELPLYLHNAATMRPEGGDPEVAQRRFQRALEGAGAELQPRILHNLGVLLEEVGEDEAAEKAFTEAAAGFAAVDGDRRPTLVRRARLVHRRGGFDEAVELYLEAMQLVDGHDDETAIRRRLEIWLGDARSATFR